MFDINCPNEIILTEILTTVLDLIIPSYNVPVIIKILFVKFNLKSRK